MFVYIIILQQVINPSSLKKLRKMFSDDEDDEKVVPTPAKTPKSICYDTDMAPADPTPSRPPIYSPQKKVLFWSIMRLIILPDRKQNYNLI